jgi:serine/threonine protein kinase
MTGLDELIVGDPRTIADLVLGVVVRTQDAVYIEPEEDDSYAITVERASEAIAATHIEARLAMAVIARLAFIADLDLSVRHTTSAVIPVRCMDRHTEVVVTIRHGAALRADIMVLPRPRARRMSGEILGPTVGEMVGQYRLVERLGEGGMGTVFRVEHVALGREYALKMLRTKVVDHDPAAAQKFLREARIAARIRHPNIVDVFDFGHHASGRPYLVMELLEGESLADLIDGGPLAVEHVCAIARQLAAGLAAAHERGVIHADVTPSNILVTRDRANADLVKLVDFGLAELRETRVDRDEAPDYVLGTPCYISPEQIRGQPADERSDQYSLGIVLFEMIAGKPPFNHKNIRELCMKHIRDPIPDLVSPFGPLPPELSVLVERCLAKSPAQRYASMRALLADLDEVGKLVDRKGWRRWLA